MGEIPFCFRTACVASKPSWNESASVPSTSKMTPFMSLMLNLFDIFPSVDGDADMGITKLSRFVERNGGESANADETSSFGNRKIRHNFRDLKIESFGVVLILRDVLRKTESKNNYI
mmetsp:Transcript_31664/g.62724  ORF Transcript_31664/g.62724 Transcript_31664/m.62724 type:complete len:117 (+) Transcript_31664:629-979(+)